jgi:phosphatidylglycerol:prolipoprotein diacylglycerol transferase
MTYGVVYFAGILVHFVIAFWMARWLGLRRRVPLAVSGAYLLGMTVGAKVLYDIQSGDFATANLFSAGHYAAGGLWGGPLVYLGMAVPLALLLARSRLAALDLTALAAPVPMAIAKVACLCHGCCYGRPSRLPWAITFPDGDGPAPAGVPLHPTQVYEMLVLVFAAVVLHRVNQPRWRGTLLLWFLTVYGIGRALSELFRGEIEPQALWGPFTQSQWLCAAASVLSIAALLYLRRRSRGASDSEKQGGC